MKIVVAGYYGCGNIGDDALLTGLLKGLGGRHEVVALSGSPAETIREFDIQAVPRKDIRLATSAIRAADALVFGGGGLLQDTTSLLSLKYYTHLIATAAGEGKRVALLSQGIGPIRTFFGKRAASRAFAQCDLITTRDDASMQVVESLSPSTKARKAIADDLAWLAIDPDFQVPKRKAVAVSARPWKDAGPKIIKVFKGFCSRAALEGWEIVPVSFDRSMDDDVLQHVRQRPTLAETPAALLKTLAPVQHTVAMRLHAGIFSAALGIPSTLVAYDSKVQTFAESLGKEALPLEGLTEERLWEAFLADTADEDLREATEERAHQGVVNAQISIDLLEEVLGGVSEGAD